MAEHKRRPQLEGSTQSQTTSTLQQGRKKAWLQGSMKGKRPGRWKAVAQGTRARAGAHGKGTRARAEDKGREQEHRAQARAPGAGAEGKNKGMIVFPYEQGYAHPSCSITSGAMKHGVPTKVCLSR